MRTRSKVGSLLCWLVTLLAFSQGTQAAWVPPFMYSNYGGNQMYYQFQLSVDRYNGHGVDHWLWADYGTMAANYGGILVFGNGYGFSNWDLSMNIVVDGQQVHENRFTSPGDGRLFNNGQWVDLGRYSGAPAPAYDYGLRRDSDGQIRYPGNYMSDTYLIFRAESQFMGRAVGGEPSSTQWPIPPMIYTPQQNPGGNHWMRSPWVPGDYQTMIREGWGYYVNSYGLDPNDRSRWGIPRRARFVMRTWMHGRGFLEDYWYNSYYWNRDGHGGYWGGNPYEGVFVSMYAKTVGSASGVNEPVQAYGRLEIVKGEQNSRFSVGIRATGMGQHDEWIIFQRDFPNGNPNAGDAPYVGYANADWGAFTSGRNFGSRGPGGGREADSGWRSVNFTSQRGGLTRYYLVLRGNSDFGWYRVVDTRDIRPYEMNTDISVVTPDNTRGMDGPYQIARTRVDRGFNFTMSVIDTGTVGEVGDQQVAVRAVRSPAHNYGWASTFWLGSGKQVLRSVNALENDVPMPPMSTGFTRGSYNLAFTPADLSGTVGAMGRFGFSAFAQNVKTLDPNNVDAGTDYRLASATWSGSHEAFVQVYPFATATVTLGRPNRTDVFDRGTYIDLGTLDAPPSSVSVTVNNGYPAGGMYAFVTDSRGKTMYLGGNFNNPAAGFTNSRSIESWSDFPGEWFIRIVEFNPFDGANLSAFVPAAVAPMGALPNGMGSATAGFFAPYNTNMGWRLVGTYRFSISNVVRVNAQIFTGGLTR